MKGPSAGGHEGENTALVVDPGLFTTVQDLGRPGLAHLGVPRSGALDAPAATLGNRLVGNLPGSAVLETTATGCTLRFTRATSVAVTGAECAVRINGRAVAHGQALALPPGAELRIEPARSGLRSYVAVAGGFEVPTVLGSRSHDALSGLGPAPLRRGDVLPVGVPTADPRPVDVPRVRPYSSLVRVLPGPQSDWFAPGAWKQFLDTAWLVGADCNRVGVRLQSDPLPRRDAAELPSQAMVRGAVQVPSSGQPVVFLNDHPVTGGYPVIAVIVSSDLPHCAQWRPGDRVRFSPGPTPAR